MRKLLLLLSLVAVVLAALLTLELRRRDTEAWGTDSPAARRGGRAPRLAGGAGRLQTGSPGVHASLRRGCEP